MDLNNVTQQLRDILEILESRPPQTLQGEAIESSVKAFEAQADTFLWVIGAGNPRSLTCDMPHNSHQFFTGRKTNKCSSCNNIYCSDHALLYCVSCGHIL